jgi:hypothetical protein
VLPADQSKAVELLKKADQDVLLRFSMRGGAYAPFLFNSRLVKWKGKKHVLLSGKKLYVCWRPVALVKASIPPPPPSFVCFPLTPCNACCSQYQDVWRLSQVEPIHISWSLFKADGV